MRPAAARLAAAVLAAGLLLGGPAPALAEEARPTADPSAPSPTAPVPGGPPQGSGPGGVTVGGERLDTRGTVVPDRAPPLPSGVVAPGWLVADAGSGAVLAAHDTVAGTPSGLDVAGQTSSPYDLALVFRRLVADPAAVALLRTPIAEVPAVEGRSPGFQIQNENPLAGSPGNLGGKTGFTDAARHTFVTAAERGGRRIVASVMDTENVPLRAADQAGLLLDWGFSVPAGVSP